MDHEAKKSAKVVGTGSCLPMIVLTNEEIEQRVPGASAEWTWTKLGVRERRIALQPEGVDR